MPAGIGSLVVELIIDVPAKHAIAESAAFFQQVHEFTEAHIFSTDHTVDVGQAQLDPAHTASLILRHLFIEKHALIAHPLPHV